MATVGAAVRALFRRFTALAAGLLHVTRPNRCAPGHLSTRSCWETPSEAPHPILATAPGYDSAPGSRPERRGFFIRSPA